MLVETLTQKFESYFGQHADIVLWFDPASEWQGLLPHLKAHLPLVTYNDSQLHLRYQLANRQAGERMVVYLPLDQQKAEYLRPYFYTAKVHQQTIEKTLFKAGIHLPNDTATLRQLRPLLPALAVASVGKGRAFWEGIVNLETAFGRLVTDFDNTLMQFLTYPERTKGELEKQRLVRPFFELITLNFGITQPERGSEAAWANRFTSLLCLVELFVVTEQPDDFPFADVLPERVHWSHCRAFLKKWQHHELFKSSFRQRAKAIDSQYNLRSWVAALPTWPSAGTFLNVEQAVWDLVCQEMNQINDKPEAIAFARNYANEFQERAHGFWAREGDLPGWLVLAQMSETIRLARSAMNELNQAMAADSMIDRYVQEWWQVDSSYRRFRTQLDQGTEHLDAALKWTSRIYNEFLEAVNERFVTTVSQNQQWPPGGYSLGREGIWNQRDSGLRALVMVDALRYELARELAERLEMKPDQIEAGLSPLPSITPLGMAALLPDWSNFKVDFIGNDWVITAPGKSDNLARKDKRVAWLEEQLGSTAIFDLDQWLTTPINQVDKNKKWLIITSTSVDAIGENAGAVVLHTFDSLLARLEQGVRRLMACGCTEIHIATDHGFLLREAIQDSDKVEAKAESILKKHERYLIGRDLPPTELPHLPVSGITDLQAWFPRGIGCFTTPGPYNYMHGGLALQETIIPHLHIRQSPAEKLAGVSVELVGGPEIRNAVFKIRLTPEGVDLLTKPRTIVIDIVKGGQSVSNTWEARIAREVIERSLILETDYGLLIGDRVKIRVRDASTGELLSEVDGVIRVDLDF